MKPEFQKKLFSAIRQVKDFPKPGINYYDITTVLANGPLFKEVIDLMCSKVSQENPEIIVGVEARGFIFGSAIASNLELPFVPIRKHGKLPSNKKGVDYDLEYGSNHLEIHTDAFQEETDVVVVDDLLATGGTVAAANKLIQDVGGNIKKCFFLIELDGLGGQEKISPVPTYSVLTCKA